VTNRRQSLLLRHDASSIPNPIRQYPRHTPQYEIVQEQAAALGRLGRALEAALNSLAAYDAADGSPSKAVLPAREAARTQLIEAAGYALWCFIVQREA
jgi:hypothetical protein